jgi:hypothetical protein
MRIAHRLARPAAVAALAAAALAVPATSATAAPIDCRRALDDFREARQSFAVGDWNSGLGALASAQANLQKCGGGGPAGWL